MVAIGDDLLIAHPDRTLSATAVAMTVAGPAVTLLGETLVRVRMMGCGSPKRLRTVFALGVLGAAGYSLSALEISCGVAVILVLLALSDYERPRVTDAYVREDRPTPRAVRRAQFDPPVAHTMLIVPRTQAPPPARPPRAKGD